LRPVAQWQKSSDEEQKIMTIVLACDVPLSENNGTAVAGMNLKNALEAKGHQVRLLCPDASLVGQENSYVTPSINFGPLNGYVGKNGVVISQSAADVVEKALEGADHLHIMTPFFLCGTAVRRAKRRGLSVTAGFHCQAENLSNHFFLMNAHGVNRWVYRLFWNQVYNRVDCIHYPTQFIRDTFEAALGHDTPGQVISNGVGGEFTSLREEKPPEMADKFVILFTGRYSREKSHRLLIEAVSRSRHAENIQLIFAGDGPQRENLERLCRKKLKNQPVMGFVPRQELIHRIHYADLYVHPAEIEIEAIACLEAIRGGLVPLVSDSPRSATRSFALWPENTFRCNDADHLAQRIDQWIENPQKREACRQAYAGYGAHFDRQACMDAMERMIVSTHEAQKDPVL
jgi:glycosyltransferase involved in cell wall biosynthesis